MTETEIMRAAWQALLRGDTAERSRLLAPLIAKKTAQEHAAINAYRSSHGTQKIELVRQADGSYAPATRHQN